jgi:hypothetical protein
MIQTHSLDEAALALLAERGYFTGAEYEARASVSHHQGYECLVAWREAGLLAYHTTDAPPHYTAPGAPPALGRQARWLQVAQPQLSRWHRILSREDAEGVAARQGEDAPRDRSLFERDLKAWIAEGRLQAVGPKGKLRLYVVAGINPYTQWQPAEDDPAQTRLHRWAAARSILQGTGHLTVQALCHAAGESSEAASRDLKAWTEAGLLERHGSGTVVHWTLAGQGPAKPYAPRRSGRVERILEVLSNTGVLTVEGAMRVNHCVKAVARRDLNAAVLSGAAVRIGGIGTYVRWPLPDALPGVNGGAQILEIARGGHYEDREALLDEWAWGKLRPHLPVTPDDAVQVWGVGRPAASQRLAVLVAAGILRRIEDRPRPDRFEAAT